MASFLHPLIVSELNKLYNLIVFLVLTETTTATIERRLYRRPLPQLSSIATVKHQRQPSSITAVKHWRPPLPPTTADVNFHHHLVIAYL
jgi:hypothetical protein